MNKFSLYILLILIYLGLSKSFSPSETRTTFLVNEQVFSTHFKGAPISVILIESISTGFLIKTYLHRYKIVNAFRYPEEVVVRTSRSFWEKNLANKGMSIFRRKENGKESYTPLPPGSLYVGNPAYGTWDIKKYGHKEWKFFRSYKNFPEIFGWADFIPDLDFYQKMKIYESNDKPFYGVNKEFGLEGTITKKIYQEMEEEEEIILPTIKNAIKKFFSLPKWEVK